MLNKTLWIFGDSFSTPFDNKTLGIWGKEYIEWKGYVPKTFGDVLSEKLGYEVKHLAIGGCDNDTIFERIYQRAPIIKKGDIVIIGWSSIGRFRLATKDNRFITIIPNFIHIAHPLLEFISKDTIEEIIVNRDLGIYRKELYDRIEFLNWLFKESKIIHWTPFNYSDVRIYGVNHVERIVNDTKGELKDGHYSELGHVLMADKFIELINNDELRNGNNTLYKKLI